MTGRGDMEKNGMEVVRVVSLRIKLMDFTVCIIVRTYAFKIHLHVCAHNLDCVGA
jgi:hypothetical protein